MKRLIRWLRRELGLERHSEDEEFWRIMVRAGVIRNAKHDRDMRMVQKD